MKQASKLKNLQILDIHNQSNHLLILQADLTKDELKLMLKRIKKELSFICSSQESIQLKLLKKQLQSKYSIYLSNNVIQKFMKTTSCKLMHRRELDFTGIDKEIKNTIQEINRKKYFLDKNFQTQVRKLTTSNEQNKRRNMLTSKGKVSIMPKMQPSSNLDMAFIKEKLLILKDYLNEQEIQNLEQILINKIKGIKYKKYGTYAEKIRNYTVYDTIIQTIFSLIREDTKNIEIRLKYQQLYKKMKQQMVSIVTNEDQIHNLMKAMQTPGSKTVITSTKLNKNLPKKNYYQLDKDKMDLTQQIEETINSAKRAIKEAFIKRGRPDFAYDMEICMEHRVSPTFTTKKIL